jgi:hypothetical protein
VEAALLVFGRPAIRARSILRSSISSRMSLRLQLHRCLRRLSHLKSMPSVRFNWFVRSCPHLLNDLPSSCSTRYGWVVSPYPEGTFTPQETPSFAWRTNENVSRRAGSRLEPSPTEVIARATPFNDQRVGAVGCNQC